MTCTVGICHQSTWILVSLCVCRGREGGFRPDIWWPGALHRKTTASGEWKLWGKGNKGDAFLTDKRRLVPPWLSHEIANHISPPESVMYHFKSFLFNLYPSLSFRYVVMGNLLKVLTCTDLAQEPNFFLDFESKIFLPPAQPSSVIFSASVNNLPFSKCIWQYVALEEESISHVDVGIFVHRTIKLNSERLGVGHFPLAI